jgi:glycine/D-amino acid oxidase-like deaminating enzyme
MLSFWERESFLRYNVIVIGSGIVGLSAAIEVKRRRPDWSVLVLERGIFPTGASTRNAGFACFGSPTEILADIQSTGEEQALALIERRRRGLALLRERLGDDAIGYQEHGGYELLFSRDLGVVDQIDYLNDLLRPIIGSATFVLRNELIEEFRFNTAKVRGLVLNPYEGQIDTGAMMRTLIRYARESGVEILTGAEVIGIDEEAAIPDVIVRDPVTQEPVTFRPERVVVCANAMIHKLLPEIDIKPGRGQVMITEPIDGLPWKGTFHFDQGFYYFRNVGERVLFGGGRNLAFDQERSNEFSYNPIILDRLETLLSEVILPDVKFRIDQKWTGIMGFSEEKCPIVRRLGEAVVVGFGCNGMGVALGSEIGRKAADLAVE